MKVLPLVEKLWLPKTSTVLSGANGKGSMFSYSQGAYRYLLWRQLNHSSQTCLFIMLNPSIADAVRLDPTVKKCIHWAREWGFGRLEVVNIFAYVSTDPTPIRKGYDWIVGPYNDAYIEAAIDRSDRIIVAWGAHGTVMNRGDRVLKLIEEAGRSAWCFGVTKADKQPRHPLYIGYKTKLINIDRAIYDAINWQKAPGILPRQQ